MEKFNDQFTPEDVEIASALTDDELRARIALYQKILESRKPVNMVLIDWEGTVSDIRKGKPYFAVLTNVNGAFHYEFVSTISYDSHKYNAAATAVFLSYYPLKQGLKPCFPAKIKQVMKIFILLSIKTRIETASTKPPNNRRSDFYPTIH